MRWNACMYAYLGVLFNHNNINVPVSLFFQLVSKEKWNAFKEHLKLIRWISLWVVAEVKNCLHHSQIQRCTTSKMFYQHMLLRFGGKIWRGYTWSGFLVFSRFFGKPALIQAFCGVFLFVFLKNEQLNRGRKRKRWGRGREEIRQCLLLHFSVVWFRFGSRATLSLTLRNTTEKHTKKSAWSKTIVLSFDVGSACRGCISFTNHKTKKHAKKNANLG